MKNEILEEVTSKFSQNNPAGELKSPKINKIEVDKMMKLISNMNLTPATRTSKTKTVSTPIEREEIATKLTPLNLNFGADDNDSEVQIKSSTSDFKDNEENALGILVPLNNLKSTSSEHLENNLGDEKGGARTCKHSQIKAKHLNTCDIQSKRIFCKL